MRAVHDIGQGMLSVVAGIYPCSTPKSRIRFNRVHDVSRRDYGGWGIYTDQGSHDMLIRQNLVHRCQEGNAIGASGTENCGTNVCVFDRNLYWHHSGAPVRFGLKSFAEWQALGQDQHSLVGDPLFVDAAQATSTCGRIPRQSRSASSHATPSTSARGGRP